MSYTLTSMLPHWDLHNKRVFLRADLNIPIQNGQVNDFRLKAVQPTIDYILTHHGKLIVASHMARPHGYDPAYSLKNLIPWFNKQGYIIAFANTIHEAHTLVTQQLSADIILLENLRFFSGETTQDSIFAESLARLADYYVNDAFGTLHRSDSSVKLVPCFFEQNHRTIGFLVEHELNMLNKLLIEPKRPFMLIVGGNKISDKIPLIESLLPKLDALLLAPAIATQYVQAITPNTALPSAATDLASLCRRISQKASLLNINIYTPDDYQIKLKNNPTQLFILEAQSLSIQESVMTIGPKTIMHYCQHIAQAKTIIYNGLMGFKEEPETLSGFQAIMKCMSRTQAYTVLAGGDTVAAAELLGYNRLMSFCSTGGGATIAYLTGQELEGLEAII